VWILNKIKRIIKIIVINFLKLIFTWWNRQTLGTFIYTLFLGKYVGSDEFGNKYYSNSKDKRWVIYKNIVESTQIPSEWYLWIHFLEKNKPSEKVNKFSWQKQHKENLTGTKEAYKPEGSLSSSTKKNMKKYEIWKS
tara:strand:- start:181 stop:591 length:411 start_codon:yes stop_codon:yes gene_type:complete